MIKKAVVTGASGYIGRHLVAELARRGVETVAVSRSPISDVPTGVRFMVEDVFAPSEELMAEISTADVLLHFAWRDGFVLQSRAHGDDLSSHHRFLLAAADAGVGRIAVAGTMHEVGYHEGPVTAETPERPASPYGVAKRALRELLALQLPGRSVDLQWLRCFYIVGDDEHSQSVFSKIRAAALRGDPIFPFTSGKNEYDFIDIGVLAVQIVDAVSQGEHTGIIHCCSGVPESLADRVERYISDNGWRIRLEYGAFPDRPFDSPGIWGDATTISLIQNGTVR
ncbi:NAD(P)-dependent oxidoreductase [Microcella daejeonensis]|uniref:NAD(P)-dependent oxidoreductase n=1 Tax=Microcella daejeonensis TaxID=2994971 RepID=A0A9E8MLL5_9MICO|nr:NAD(P)-dependent oxidoreductase [Microcella daejeonensis]WAB81879.1 NAD(P)-dependent oxidoreductase [Microcella daejeonensis]